MFFRSALCVEVYWKKGGKKVESKELIQASAFCLALTLVSIQLCGCEYARVCVLGHAGVTEMKRKKDS